MEETEKKQVAVFRFGVIADFVGGVTLERGEYEKLLREKSKRRYEIPGSMRRRISRSTIKHWVRRYEAGGRRLEALYPQEREDAGRTRAWNGETAEAIAKLRQELPRASVPRLMMEMAKRGIIRGEEELAKTTVYRFLHRRGLMKGEAAEAVDRRRFEAECVNDLWQSDAMHGPEVMHEGRKRKAYLLAMIDDHSRLITHGQFYLSEGIESYLDCLRQGLLKRGIPRKLYVDNGSAFRSRHLEQVTASLGISLIHSRVGEPEGRGKIERFFRTVRENFLGVSRAENVAGLNQEYEQWLSEWYHSREHGSTGESPLERFAGGLECVRRAPGDLEDYFRKEARRRVEKDRTITLVGRLYEAPLVLIGKRVNLYYHEHDPYRVEVKHEKQSHGFLRALDLNVNARVKRERKDAPARQDNPNVQEMPNQPIMSGRLPLAAQGGTDHE
jgi:transposase InsO family protein